MLMQERNVIIFEKENVVTVGSFLTGSFLTFPTSETELLWATTRSHILTITSVTSERASV